MAGEIQPRKYIVVQGEFSSLLIYCNQTFSHSTACLVSDTWVVSEKSMNVPIRYTVLHLKCHSLLTDQTKYMPFVCHAPWVMVVEIEKSPWNGRRDRAKMYDVDHYLVNIVIDRLQPNSHCLNGLRDDCGVSEKSLECQARYSVEDSLLTKWSGLCYRPIATKFILLEELSCRLFRVEFLKDPSNGAWGSRSKMPLIIDLSEATLYPLLGIDCDW